MKKVKPIKETLPDSLPFSFFKGDVDEEKIKAHWRKIKEKIEKELPESSGKERDNN